MTELTLPLDRLDSILLARGAHTDRSNGLCAMEVVSWIAGEPHSDNPECACPVISRFLRSWNDSIRDDAIRTRLLRPILPLVVGTRSTPEIERKRSFLALDWLIRVHLAAWLDLVPTFKAHADAVRGAAEIVDLESAKKVGGNVVAAMVAARAAAWAAAGAPARKKLSPVVEMLQSSAQDLVRAMCAVGRPATTALSPGATRCGRQRG